MRGRLAVTAIALVLAGCGTSTPSPSPSPTAAPSPAGTPSTTGPTGPAIIDSSLLDHLPTEVDGVPVMRRPESDAAAAADPVVIQFGEGVVTALAVDPATEDFAYAALVRLRPGAFSEDLYRSWRDSFDEGACSQAGGVVRTAVARIADREVHVDSCAGGVRTYHVWLRNSRVLVSVSALGERNLGEKLVEGLRE